MRNSHLVPVCHRSLDLLSLPTPLSFPLFLLLFPLRGIVCRLTSGSPRPPATSDPERHVIADAAVISMATGYVTQNPGDDLPRDLHVSLLEQRSRSMLDDYDLERRRSPHDLEQGDDLDKYDVERRHLEKHDPSVDHLENRDLRRHDLEKHDLKEANDLERQHPKRDDGGVHLANVNITGNLDDHLKDLDLQNLSRSFEDLDLDNISKSSGDLENSSKSSVDLDHILRSSNDLDHTSRSTDDLDLENSSRSPETSPTSAAIQPADLHAYHRPFDSLKLPVLPSPAADVTSRRRHRNVTRYRLVFHGSPRQQQQRSLLPGADVSSGGSVNLMIIPLGAIFVFIVIWVLHVSRWCIEDIREADGMHAKRHLGPGFISSGAPPRPLAGAPRSSLPAIERIAIGTGRACSANSETDLARLHTRARIQRQTRIVPARSTRSLNGIRDRHSDRANRKLLAIGSDSSIPMTEMTSSSAVRYIRHAERARALPSADLGVGGIVESCKRAVGSFLQSHLIVVPVSSATGNGNGGPETRTRNHSSPASSSKTGSSCSESRPLLAHCSSSSDGGRMTSSDSNIDVMSPLSVRRRLAGETRYRTKPSCVNSAGNLLANRIVAVQHGRLHPSVGGRPVGYGHQSSAPAVSKLVHESLNLSFRFFQVPLSSNNSSSSAKDSLDSVFVCGIYADDATATTPTVATPTSASDTLRTEADVYGGVGGTTTFAAVAQDAQTSRPRHHQPMPSKERAALYSLFDRQSSIGEEEASGAVTTGLGGSALTLNDEGPEVDCIRLQGRHLTEVTQEGGTGRGGGGCRHGGGGGGDGRVRRTRSANELQAPSCRRDKRSGKCLTT